MNKYQEALDWFTQWEVVREKLKDYNFYNEVKIETPLKVLQELVDKETPMKPFLAKADSAKECFGCSSCMGVSIQSVYKHCPYCGQKIDWSDVSA